MVRKLQCRLLFFNNKTMHYHLSASKIEYRKLSPTNLMLYEIALFGCKNGYSSFHLGGGLGGKTDNLYKFKKSFNKNEDTNFYVGKIIYNEQKYEELALKSNNSDNLLFFPKYRFINSEIEE